MTDYQFTNSWFEGTARPVWEQLLPRLRPRRILEVGSYEGASACYLIDKLGTESEIEIHCVDNWQGSMEHRTGANLAVDMDAIESRFNRNIRIAVANSKHKVNLIVHKRRSDDCLAGLISDGKKSYFDFIYIDGSHQAPDVICDAVLGFKLLRVGGVMAFDDYIWSENPPFDNDPIRCPKSAIDAFVNLNIRKLNILQAPLYQLYIQKLSD